MTDDRYMAFEEADGIATLRLIDAAGRNALSQGMLRCMVKTFEAVKASPTAKVVVLGGLPDVFCSGADLIGLEDLASGRVPPTELLLPRLVLDLPVPVIAAMEGHAVGGGLALGLCADILLIARESRYGCSFMNMGFTPGMGLSVLLQSVMSPAVAAELMLTGEMVKGRALEGRAGFNYVLPKAAVWPKAMDLAERIAEKPRPALTLLKRALSLSKRQAFESARTVESFMHEVSFAQPETIDLIRDYFAGMGR